jgi:hypothetical protein
METLAKSDIFFFVTTVAIMLLTVMGLIISIYLIRILSHASKVSKKIKDESENISRDIAIMRAKVHEEGLGVKTVFNVMKGFFGNSLGKKKRRSATTKPSSKVSEE